MSRVAVPFSVPVLKERHKSFILQTIANIRRERDIQDPHFFSQTINVEMLNHYFEEEFGREAPFVELADFARGR